MRTLTIIVILIAVSISVKAQNATGAKGKVSGKVIDANTKAPVDYSTISVFRQGETSPFNGISADPKGNFVVSGLAPGDYRLTIEFIGYRKKTFDHVIITSAVSPVSLGTILLVPVQTQLNAVTVTAARPVVENQIDKLVYNPANDLTAQGGVALDVLRKVPQVTVDIDGNVEVQGNSNIRFLINGKPSSIFGASLADALQTIPASQIKSIEVITSPGAKYDAEGTGGIINIILKDSKVQGINGSVNLSAGTRLENGSFNLNARSGNIGVNAYFSGNEQLNSTTLNSINSTSTDSLKNITRLSQNGQNSFKRSGYQSGVSFDWNITKKDELTATFGFNHFGNNSNGFNNQLQTVNDVAGTTTGYLLSQSNSTSHFSANSTDVSLSYKKTFDKKDEELDVLINSSSGKNSSAFTQVQNYLAGGYPSQGQMGNNPGKDRETDISIDYTDPVSKKFTFETGAKAVIENINNSVVTDTLLNNGSYVLNQNQTYGFNYKRNIFAYYVSATFSLFHDFINGKAGLRYENTSTSSDFPGVIIPTYGTFAPSFVLQHKLDETQSLKFSYSYRIERPDYGDLNPFLNISNPHNISTGNPELKPELGHNYEFGYNKLFNKGANIYVAAFYRYNTDDIQSFTTHYNVYDVNGTIYDNVYLNQRYNIGSEKNIGANLYVSVPLNGKLTLRSNMFFADRITDNPGLPEVSGFAYRLNLNASYNFGHNIAAEFFGNYRSSQRNIQGTSPGFGFYNFAVRKQFWNKNASIGLTAANPFNMYINQTSTTTGNGFTQTNMRQVPFRSFGISLSYKFGKLEFKKEKEEDNNPNLPPEAGQSPR